MTAPRTLWIASIALVAACSSDLPAADGESATSAAAETGDGDSASDAGDGDGTSGDGDGTSGDGDGTSGDGDGTSGDGDGTSGDGDGTSGDGDGSSGDGDGSSGDGDGTSGDGDGTSGDGDGSSGDGDGSSGDGDGSSGDGDGTSGDGDGSSGDGDGSGGDGTAGDGDGSSGDGTAGDGDGTSGDGTTGDGDGCTPDLQSCSINTDCCSGLCQGGGPNRACVPTGDGDGTTGDGDGTTGDGTTGDGDGTTAGDGTTGDGDGTTSGDGTTGDGDGTTGDGDGDGTTGDGDGDGSLACVDDNRVIAFLANWQACPTAAQMAQYSHVMIAFAVTYQWDPGGNICDTSCTIGSVPGCTGSSLSQLVTDLHAQGIKVMLSFGGAGMGGIWEGTCGAMTKCWDYCLDKATSLATQLTSIVQANDLDGIDIDYEYCLSDATYRSFVTDLTTELRTQLDTAFPGERKLITHTPMDSELDVGDEYYTIMQNVASDVDMLMPQYYNGFLNPFTDLPAVQSHFGDLVNGVYGGDASKVVFGYCIEPGCNPTATQPAALNVTQQMAAAYPDNGGVFFWAHPNDTGAWFSQPFRDYFDTNFCGP